MKPIHRATLLLLAAALVAAPVLAAETVTENFDQTYALAAGGRIALENVNGGVQITVWDRNEVRVQAVKEAESREQLDTLKIEVATNPASLTIVTRYPNDRGLSSRRGEHRSVEYTLTVPKGASLDKIELVNGSLTVTGVAGDVQAELVNGEARVSGLAGNATIHTVNGAVLAEADRLERGQRLDLESVNGRTELALPASVSADVRAETVNGSIANDFGLTVTKHEFVGRDMAGTIGAGGATVRMNTVNGSIQLRKK